MTKEKLLKRKEKYENLLKQADEANNLILCIKLSKTLDEIDRRLRNMENK